MELFFCKTECSHLHSANLLIVVVGFEHALGVLWTDLETFLPFQIRRAQRGVSDDR